MGEGIPEEVLNLKSPALTERGEIGNARTIRGRKAELYIRTETNDAVPIGTVIMKKLVHEEKVGLIQVHNEDYGLVGIKSYCKKCGKDLNWENISKGFGRKNDAKKIMEDGKILTPEQIETIRNEDNRIIIEFMDRETTIPLNMFNSNYIFSLTPEEKFPKKEHYKAEENRKNIATVIKWYIANNTGDKILAFYQNRYGIIEGVVDEESKETKLIFFGLYYPDEVVPFSEIADFDYSAVLQDNQKLLEMLSKLPQRNIRELKDGRIERFKQTLFKEEEVGVKTPTLQEEKFSEQATATREFLLSRIKDTKLG